MLTLLRQPASAPLPTLYFAFLVDTLLEMEKWYVAEEGEAEAEYIDDLRRFAQQKGGEGAGKEALCLAHQERALVDFGTTGRLECAPEQQCGGMSDRWGGLGPGVRSIGAVRSQCWVLFSVSRKRCLCEWE